MSRNFTLVLATLVLFGCCCVSISKKSAGQVSEAPKVAVWDPSIEMAEFSKELCDLMRAHDAKITDPEDLDNSRIIRIAELRALGFLLYQGLTDEEKATANNISKGLVDRVTADPSPDNNKKPMKDDLKKDPAEKHDRPTSKHETAPRHDTM